ncbi:MAG: hypothetical protein QMB52_04615 [Propionivibrio sp.]
MNEQSAIPAEWRTAAEETAKALSVARAIERRQYPEGDAPAGLVGALVVSVAVTRASAAISNRIEGVYDALSLTGEPNLIPCLRAITEELKTLAHAADQLGRRHEPL